MTLNNLGALYWGADKFSQAEKAYNKALTFYRALAQKSPDLYTPDIAMTLSNLGRFYQTHEMGLKAREAYNEAIEIRMSRALWFELVESFSGLSSLLNTEPKKAVRLLELAILFSGEEKYKYAQKGRRESLYIDIIQNTKDTKKILGILEALRDLDLLSLEWDLAKIQKSRKNINLQKKLVKELLESSISPLHVPYFQLPEWLLFLYIQKINKTVLYLAVTQDETEIYKGSTDFMDIASQLLVNFRVQSYAGKHNRNLDPLISKFDDLSRKWTENVPLPVRKLLSEKEIIVFSPDSTISSFPLEGLYIDGNPACLSKPVVRARSIHQLLKTGSKSMVADSSLIIGNPWNSGEDSLAYFHPSKVGPLKYLEGAVKEAEMLDTILPNSEFLLVLKLQQIHF